MSTVTSAKRQLGLVAIAAMTAAAGGIGYAAAKAIEIIASFIAHRAERRLLRELADLDDRLLDDIGIDRGGTSSRPRGRGTERRGLLPQHLR
jgi:uncharacterized protein YjiS (DUF1127 family)